MAIEKVIGTKVVAFDIYGTVIPERYDTDEDGRPDLRIRDGFYSIAEQCKQKNISIVSASDESTNNQKNVFKDYNISVFHKLYQLVQIPKDFSIIIQDQGIEPHQLLVIGDTFEKDILGAIESGAQYVQVTKYAGNGTNTDISFIKLE